MVSYYQGVPDLYTIKFTAGKVAAHGRGISFWYFSGLTTVIELPATAITQPFIFNEATLNFQDVTLQGNVTYRVSEPLVTSERLDFRKKSRLRPVGDGHEKLNLLVVSLIQSHARARVSVVPLETVLTEVGKLSEAVTQSASADPAFEALGIKIEAVYFSSARAQPDIQKALQTEHREKIQRQADMAIFARRAAAVENEKAIKESELATEIGLAERRKQLVETEAANTIRIAKAEAEAAQLKIAAYKGVSTATMAGLALKDWADKGGTVGNLTLTGDLLSELTRHFQDKAR